MNDKKDLDYDACTKGACIGVKVNGYEYCIGCLEHLDD